MVLAFSESSDDGAVDEEFLSEASGEGEGDEGEAEPEDDSPAASDEDLLGKFFDEVGAGEEGSEESDEDPLADEAEPENEPEGESQPDKEKHKESGAQKRIRELATKNRRLRDEQISLKSKIQAIESVVQERKTLTEMFPDATDPVREVTFLKDFADTILNLRQTDQDIAYAVNRVIKVMKGENTVPQTKQEPKPDPKIDALATEVIRGKVLDFVNRAKIAPNYRQAVTNGISRRIGADKIGTTSDAMFKDALKSVLDENGWTVATIRNETTRKPEEPKIGKKSGAAMTVASPKEKAAKANGGKPAPKTLREWQNDGKEVVSSIMDQLKEGQSL